MSDYIKPEIFIPETHFSQLQKALQNLDAGHIGNYNSCLSYFPVIGTRRPLEGTRPFSGEEGKVSCEPELKVEVTIKAENLNETIKAIKAVHPYEEPVINAIPLIAVGLLDTRHYNENTEGKSGRAPTSSRILLSVLLLMKCDCIGTLGQVSSRSSPSPVVDQENFHCAPEWYGRKNIQNKRDNFSRHSAICPGSA